MFWKEKEQGYPNPQWRQLPNFRSFPVDQAASQEKATTITALSIAYQSCQVDLRNHYHDQKVQIVKLPIVGIEILLIHVQLFRFDRTFE